MESDVQQTSKNNKEIDMSEGCSSEQQNFKIPCSSKLPGSPKKKLLKNFERPSSAKSFVTLENKYKASLVKYQKELKEMQVQNDKVRTMRESMMRLRDEMQEKGQTELTPLPDIPSTINVSSFGSPRTPRKGKKSQDSSNTSRVYGDELNSGKHHLDEEIVEFIKTEMPNLERTLKSLDRALNAAHLKQNNLETNLDVYKEDIAIIMNDFENLLSIKKNSELLIKELDNIKEEFQNERSSFRKDMESKDQEIKQLRGSFETEFSKRKSLEDAYSSMTTDRNRLKEDCEDYVRQIEKMKKTPIPTGSDDKQDLAIINGQLQYEVEDLKTKLSLAQRKLSTVTEENTKNKQEVRKLVVEREEIKNEFINHCHQILFEKENQIYSIKSKMDSIVNLKNTIISYEDRGEPFFDIDLVLKINDANTLKKEVVVLHKKLISNEENRCELERRISTKDIKISGLEEELVIRSQELIRMDHLIDMMKRKDWENAQLLAAVNLSPELLNDHQSFEDTKEEKIKGLIAWYEKQRDMVAELEKELRSSEERYSLSEERRVRNEERIAKLQLKLAKYQYLR